VSPWAASVSGTSGIIKPDPRPSLIILVNYCGMKNQPGIVVRMVYRDPVDKIVAGFYYCQEQYPHLNNLDLFLDTYQHQLKNNYIRVHCRTNTDMLGPDPSIYTHVWNMNEIDTKLLPFLEQLGGKKIQKTRLRGHPPRVITEAQKTKAKEVMAIDYKNGWCKELICSRI